jgi:hypothetical protein
MQKAISFLLTFIFVLLILVIVGFRQEIDRLNAVIVKDNVVIDSLRGEIEIEVFDKNRYISIIDQLSITNCKEVKQIIDGTE